MKKYLAIFVVGILVFLAKSSPSFAIDYLPTDNFTANNGTDIHVYNTAYISNPPGVATIQNNAVKLNNIASSDSGFSYTNSTLPSSYCVDADITTSNSNASAYFGGSTYDWIRISNGNYFFAYNVDTSNNQIHFYIGGINNSDAYINGIPNSNEVHHVKICDLLGTLTAYYDSSLLETIPGQKSASGDVVGLSTNIDGNDYVTIDNLRVYDNASSPTPTPIQLPVPLVKQTGPTAPWRGATYDLATVWSPTNYTIGTWGCALTSATMVLQYYQILNLPGNGNLALTPGTLDAWLGTQPDGYVPNGNVNWLAISRLTKQAKTNNSNFLFDALEYQRSNFTDTITLLADLTSNHPDILEEPGHFIVATGKNTSNVFTINDPYYNRTLLSDYDNTFSSLGRYIPSLTDLSYMLFTSDPSLTVTLKDSTNTPIGTSYTQQPLSGAGTTLTAGNPINLLYLQKPGNGTYTLTVSGTTSQLYTVKGFFYDTNGNVRPFSQTGTVDPNNSNTLTLHFDNQNLGNDSATKIVAISSFLSDLKDLYTLGYVKKGAYESIKSLGENVQIHIQQHKTLVVKIDLGVIKTLLNVDKGIKQLNDTAYQILSADVEYLQSHL